MDGEEHFHSSEASQIDPPACKKSKVFQKKEVVTVRIEASSEKYKGEGLPSDSCSWRKYGQKTIKGSPHPRGYYKCSTFKGCPAKKQVERCKTDASLLIITYTSNHNHSFPDQAINSVITRPKGKEENTQEKKPLREAAVVEVENGHLGVNLDDDDHDDEEIDGIFDELEELPIFSSALV